MNHAAFSRRYENATFGLIGGGWGRDRATVSFGLGRENRVCARPGSLAQTVENLDTLNSPVFETGTDLLKKPPADGAA